LWDTARENRLRWFDYRVRMVEDREAVRTVTGSAGEEMVERD